MRDTAGTRCAPSQLSLTFRLAPTGDTRSAVILLTNIGSQTCHLQGFPGVELIGPSDSTFGPRYELPRSSMVPYRVELAPGVSTHASLQVLVTTPGSDANVWVPKQVLVTPPDTTQQLSAPWPSSVGVLRQDGATHPGTFVNPLR